MAPKIRKGGSQTPEHWLSQTGTVAQFGPEYAGDPSYPLNPIAPNKTLTLAVALTLGLMLGVFIVFLKEYWRNDTGHLVPANDKVE